MDTLRIDRFSTKGMLTSFLMATVLLASALIMFASSSSQVPVAHISVPKIVPEIVTVFGLSWNLAAQIVNLVSTGASIWAVIAFLVWSYGAGVAIWGAIKYMIKRASFRSVVNW